MKKPKIAFVSGDKPNTLHLMLEMEERGFDTNYFGNFVPALEDLTRNRYSLIVINPHIAPGGECDDSVIRKVMDTSIVEYWKVGLRLVELVKADGSINKDTPIVAIEMYDRDSDPLWPHARMDCQRIGIVDYFCVSNSDFDYRSFYNKLERIARGK